MDIGATFGADAQASGAFQPGESAFDWPANLAQAGAVFDTRRSIMGVMPRARTNRRYLSWS
jgi:hypothetical protein